MFGLGSVIGSVFGKLPLVSNVPTNADPLPNSTNANNLPTPCTGLGQGVALKLKFHPAHGKAVKLCENSRAAERDGRYFEHGVLFSHRPIAVNECVAVEITAMAFEFNGPLRIGFTSINPNTYIESENSISVPLGRDLKYTQGVWINGVHLHSLEVGTTIYWKVMPDGKVLYGVDGFEGGIFLRDVNTSVPLWAVVEAYGYVKGVRFVDKSMMLTHEASNSNSNVNVTVYSSPNLRASRSPPRISSRRLPNRNSIFGGSSLAIRRNVTLSPLQDFNRIFIPSALNSPCSPSPFFTSPQPWSQNSHGFCIICTDQDKNTAFSKCGHVCMCYECAVSFTKIKVSSRGRPRQRQLCPICRAPIASILRIYN